MTSHVLVGELDKILIQHGEDFKAKFWSAFNFTCEFERITNDDEWATVTDNGNNLWGTITDKCIYLTCGLTGDKYQDGRLPSDAKVYANPDTMCMFAVRAVSPLDPCVSFPLPCVEDALDCSAPFVNQIFLKLSGNLKVVKSCETVLEELQLSTIDTQSNRDFTSSVQALYALEMEAIEQAYNGILMELPELHDTLKANIKYVEELENTDIDKGLYDLPAGHTFDTYIAFYKNAISQVIDELYRRKSE